MECLDENTVVQLLERQLTEARRGAIYRHLDQCEDCQRLLAAFADAPDELADPVGIAPSSAVTACSEQPLESESAAAAKANEVEELTPGTMVGHFRVARLLGRGGMGEVYLAHDAELGRKVALKLVRRADLGTAQLKTLFDRFRTEARATARVVHPNIVAVHAVGEYRGRPYLALEYVRGQTLSNYRDDITVAEAVRVARHIAEALTHAHSNGVLHRDLKPANVLIDYRGHVQVADFGLAKIVDLEPVTSIFSTPVEPSRQQDDEPAQRESESGNEPDGVPEGSAEPAAIARHSSMMGGTPTYMSPEQWDSGQCSGATDVWALGVILFQMCAKRHPFEPPDAVVQLRELRYANLVAAVCDGPPAPSLDQLVAVPPALAELVAACLERDPKRRPLTSHVAERLAEIEGSLSREPTSAIGDLAPDTSALESTAVPDEGNPPARRRIAAWLGVLAVVVVAAGLVGIMRDERAPSAAHPSVPTASGSASAAVRASTAKPPPGSTEPSVGGGKSAKPPPRASLARETPPPPIAASGASGSHDRPSSRAAPPPPPSSEAAPPASSQPQPDPFSYE